MGNYTMNKQECMEKYDVLLRLFAQIQEDQSNFYEALETLEKMPHGTPGDIAGQAKAMAIGDALKAREHTNQELIRVYQNMYYDLRTDLFATDSVGGV
ncbi:MAG: hypothetical protein LIO74_10845 [Ruminococcus sp.]|nr:hypothetical protein [Ruminococcus sp.]